MKTNSLRTLAASLSLVGCMGAGGTVWAQESTAAASQATAQSTTAVVQASATAAPQLPYGASQILQLVQAKVADDTIVTYIRSSGNSYNLNADQIIFLQQQGLSSSVLNAMLSQPRAGVYAGNASATYTAQPNYSQPTQVQAEQQPASTVTVGPAVTAIDPSAVAAAPTTVYYYQPTYYPDYSYPYYPYYYGYPAVTVGFGWGWGGGWRGGWHGLSGL